MRQVLKLSAALMLTAGTAFAAGKNNTHDHNVPFKPHVHEKTVITVSCFRGPTTDVIWDRPNSVFIDSLVNAGYDFSTAHAIGERVCRDHDLVGKPGALKAAMEKIFFDSASHRNANH